MEAVIGDRICIHGNVVGHTGLVFPGPDAVIEHPDR